jgi:hypothetical protein
MDQGHAHSSGSEDVTGPMLRVEMKDTKSSTDEEARKTGGISREMQSSTEDSSKSIDVERAKTGTTVATVVQQGRKRTGSLRQAAMAKMRERIVVTPPSITTMADTPTTHEVAAHNSMFENTTPMLSSENEERSHNKDISPQSTARHDSQNQQMRSDLKFISSPTASGPAEPYVSTTDEEDLTSALRSTASSSNSSFNYSASARSMSLTRRRSHRTELRTAPAAAAVPALADTDMEDDEWDYSETEWWGWVILAATWIVFVVVMGSCFGIWSWAWDVGETPYAPPDLEDDDTLPITGYYPALMVCTAVMSWVWVVVAWVGMVSESSLNYVQDITNC